MKTIQRAREAINVADQRLLHHEQQLQAITTEMQTIRTHRDAWKEAVEADEAAMKKPVAKTKKQ